MSYLTILRTQLEVDEGIRFLPYKDSKNKVSIGIGRNLSDVGLSKDEMELMYRNDAIRADLAAHQLFPTFDTLTDNRKAVLCNMAFNLGYNGLSLFHSLAACIAAGDWEGAAKSMENSLWAKQVPNRAKRLVKLMRSG